MPSQPIAHLLKARSLRIALTTLLSTTILSLPESSKPADHLLSFSSPVFAQTPNQPNVEADQLLQQGIQQFTTSQFQAALESWQQALNLYQQSGDRTGEAKTYSYLGIIYYSVGDYTKALEYQQQSLMIAQENSDRAQEAAALGNLAIIYNALGEYAKALEYQQQNLAIARERSDRAEEGASLSNLGVTYYYLGDYTQSIEYHQQYLTVAREIGDRAGEGIAFGNLGIAYDALGDYAKAIEYQQQSLAIAREFRNRVQEASAVGNLGIAYNALGDYAKAIEYHQQHLTIAREIGDRKSEGQALSNLGHTYRALGDYAKAVEYHQQHLMIAREIGDRQGEGVALGSLGNAYYTLEDYTKAIEYHQQSLDLARAIGDRAGEGIALMNLGATYNALEDYSKAIEYHQKSLAIAREINSQAGVGNALTNLGLALMMSGKLPEAEEILRQGIEILENIRGQLGDNDAWKVSIFEQQARGYRLLQQVLIAQNRFQDALEISERGRARAFVELMAKRLASESEVTPKVDFPNLEQIQQIAKTENAVLVEYSIISEEILCIWVIQPTGEVAFRAVDLTEQQTSLSAIAERVHLTTATGRIRGTESTDTVSTETVSDPREETSNVSTVAPPANTQRQSNRNLQQLHQVLIEPIADLLPTDPNQPVIFIPQGTLFLVPFAALQDTQGQYLIEKHTILTAPAIQVLELTNQYENNATGDILIVGNPTMPKVSLNPTQPPQQLKPLPGAEQEAIAIASLLNAEVFIGDRATEAIVKQKIPQARIIHLATHGLLEDFSSNGFPGAIALTSTSEEDGLLAADEILALDMNADLVVLSACDTGRGKITGDGVVGLSRSILTAGAASTIVSLWQVPDEATSALMTEFYRQWQQTGNKAQALRQAMLTTMAQYPHPMNWAAFTLMGEAD